MRTRKLGWTDLHLTTIGFGTWAIGGPGWMYAWGPQDDAKSIEAIHTAVDNGVNWIDTAAVYGVGHAEEVVGRAIAGLPERPIIATKCTRKVDESGNVYGDMRKSSIKHEAEESLTRLGVDVIDLYQVHWPDPDEYIEEAWEAMAELADEGKIRYVGVSNFSAAQMERIRPIHPIASLQPPYSMLKRGIETDQLPYCREHNIGVVAYSPMQKGLLTGAFSHERVENLPGDDHRRRDPLFNEPRFSRILSLVEALTEIADRFDKSPSQLALAWVLRKPEVTSAIAGARKPWQIRETAAAGDWELPDDVQREMDTLLEEYESSL